MKYNLSKRTTTKEMSKPNMVRCLTRITKELEQLIEAAPCPNSTKMFAQMMTDTYIVRMGSLWDKSY